MAKLEVVPATPSVPKPRRPHSAEVLHADAVKPATASKAMPAPSAQVPSSTPISVMSPSRPALMSASWSPAVTSASTPSPEPGLTSIKIQVPFTLA